MKRFQEAFVEDSEAASTSVYGRARPELNAQMSSVPNCPSSFASVIFASRTSERNAPLPPTPIRCLYGR